ncbi:MAG: hypothetical protein ABIT07_12445 [Ferruginibacter sp.]
MDLDELKKTWNEMSTQLPVNQDVNFKKFDKMSKKKLRSKLNKIIIPEIAGSLVCVGSAAFIGFNFYRLDSPAFQIVGIITVILLVILAVISLLSIKQLYQGGDLNKSYSDTLKTFATQKLKFCRLQKLNLMLSYLLLVTVLLLSTRLFGRNEITDSKYFWIFSISIGYIFLVFFSKWVAQKYNGTIRQTEALLNELSN